MEETPLVPQPQGTPEIQAMPPSPQAPKKKFNWKRFGILMGGLYLLVMVLILLWGIFIAELDLAFFRALPFSQIAFNNFLMNVLNVLMGILVGVGVLTSLYGGFKSLFAKKEQVDKKKKGKRIALLGGVGTFVLMILWLLILIFIGPKLVQIERFESPIITEPANTLGLTAPIEITFDASRVPVDPNLYEIISYSWNFGDGGTATGRLVSHRYTQKGTEDGRFTVSLNVTFSDIRTGAQFSNQFLKEVSIDNEQTTAIFTAKPTSGEIPLMVNFDASASFDPDGEIVAFEWDFNGDGRFDDATGEKVEYEFLQEGTFEVTLRVTDNNGEFNTTTQTIEAGSIGGLRAVIDSPLVEGESYKVDQQYEFSGALSQIKTGNITRYSWDFGDGTKVQSRTANHAYTKKGNYTITLTVQDADGNNDSANLEILVVDQGNAPVPRVTTKPKAVDNTVSGTLPLTVEFDATQSSDLDDDIVEYEWDFDGDGVVDSKGDKVSHSYQEAGLFSAMLTAVDSTGNRNQVSVNIEVLAQGLIADLDVNTSNGEVPLTVSFDASGSQYKEGNIISYEYDFGDGSSPYVGGSKVSYKYTKVGTYLAKVTVLADDGEKATTSVQIVVRPVALTSCFTVNTSNGRAPLFLSVDPSCSQGTISAYRWDFGDGTISFDRKPEVHTYTETGSYTVNLEVTGDNGIVDDFSLTITVN